MGQPPYHFDLETVVPGIGNIATQLGKLVFHTVGDTGGVKNADYQRAVAAQMKADLDTKDENKLPRFFFHLGDVIYLNGQVTDCYDQFYEPYDLYTPPIIAIPGNLDGDPVPASNLLGRLGTILHVQNTSHRQPDMRRFTESNALSA